MYYDTFTTPMPSYGLNGSTKTTPKILRREKITSGLAECTKLKFTKITYTNVKTGGKNVTSI